jgi:hypothetical protein
MAAELGDITALIAVASARCRFLYVVRPNAVCDRGFISENHAGQGGKAAPLMHRNDGRQ